MFQLHLQGSTGLIGVYKFEGLREHDNTNCDVVSVAFALW